MVGGQFGEEVATVDRWRTASEGRPYKPFANFNSPHSLRDGVSVRGETAGVTWEMGKPRWQESVARSCSRGF